MIDREKVIKGLEQFKADFKPFCGNGSDWARVDDAINLLKEQEAVFRCKDCKHYRYYGLSQDTVSECMLDICTNQNEDWFCAEGERAEQS